MAQDNEGIKFLSVDLQNDFASEGGAFQIPGNSVQFVQSELFPFMRRMGSRAFEIISDYRQPRKGDLRDCCRPGEWGYTSLLPSDLRGGKQWIKSMNSPVWTREGAGDPSHVAGEPYQDPDDLGRWLEVHLGMPDVAGSIIVFGLSLDRCVLSTIMELSWRGYKPKVLEEGTDLSTGNVQSRSMFLRSIPFIHWGEAITFNELKRVMGGQ